MPSVHQCLVLLPSAGACVKALCKVAIPAALDGTTSWVMQAILDANLISLEVLQLAEALLPEGQLPNSNNLFKNLHGLTVMVKLVELLVRLLCHAIVS